MLHEEFVALTKVNVSFWYYTQKVEPDYNACVRADLTDKAAWCADWIKTNKKYIVRTHEFDIESMSRDVGAKVVLYQENANLKEQLSVLEAAKVVLESEVGDLKRKLDTEQNEIAVIRTEYDGRIERFRDSELAAKNSEIIKLKALLYDELTKSA
jgi:hypothetical protein